MAWRPFRLLLVVLALFGLFGQAAVYAMVPGAELATVSETTAAPMTDCACAAAAEPDRNAHPCTGITLDCIAKMGCVAAPTLASAPDLASSPVLYEHVSYSPAREIGRGLVITPEPFPPIA